MNEPDPFYIGYEPVMPPALRRVVSNAVTMAVAIAAGAASVFVASQTPLADARFEYGQVRQREGYLWMAPVPVLMIANGDRWMPHWLVATGKRGPAAALDGASDGWVSLRGTLIERESWRMIEVQPGSVRRLDSRTRPPSPAALLPARHAVARGEIVDSKCFLGVMNPGERAVHRDCAVRCLSGGVPPMFAFRDDAGSHLALLLTSDASLLRDGVGRPITLSGVLSGPEDALVFSVGGPR